LLVATAADGAYTTAVLGGFAEYEPELRTAVPAVSPAELFFVGGTGFPADVPVTIGFDDGGTPFATLQSTVDGTFLEEITMPARTRVGPRLLVASAPGGVVASWTIDVLGGRDTSMPVQPGYGLG
jgi:hypothetical protein